MDNEVILVNIALNNFLIFKMYNYPLDSSVTKFGLPAADQMSETKYTQCYIDNNLKYFLLIQQVFIIYVNKQYREKIKYITKIGQVYKFQLSNMKDDRLKYIITNNQFYTKKRYYNYD